MDALHIIRFYQLDLTPDEKLMAQAVIADTLANEAQKARHEMEIKLAFAGIDSSKMMELMCSINKKFKGK